MHRRNLSAFRLMIFLPLSLFLLFGAPISSPAADPPPAACLRDGQCTEKTGCPRAALPVLQGTWALALSWHPGFCQTRSDTKCLLECANTNEAPRFTLHGLWPQWAEYCGVPKAVSDCACSNARHKLPPVTVSPGLQPQMAQYFPDRWAQLERHEWTKHGTCSDMDQNTYFTTAIALADQVNGSALQTFVQKNVGKTVTYGALCDAAEKAFGAAIRPALTVEQSRERINGNFLLTGLMITFKPAGGKFDLKAAEFVKVDPAQPNLGGFPPTLLCDPRNLGRRVIIDAAGVE